MMVGCINKSSSGSVKNDHPQLQNLPEGRENMPAHNTPWVAPGSLIDVDKAFQVMRSSETQAIDRGDGMTWFGGNLNGFFLLRD